MLEREGGRGRERGLWGGRKKEGRNKGRRWKKRLKKISVENSIIEVMMPRSVLYKF